MHERGCVLTHWQHLRDDAAVRARVPVLGRMRVSADLLRDPLRLRRPAVLLDAVDGDSCELEHVAL
jgi:hypothetical protein